MTMRLTLIIGLVLLLVVSTWHVLSLSVSLMQAQFEQAINSQNLLGSEMGDKMTNLQETVDRLQQVHRDMRSSLKNPKVDPVTKTAEPRAELPAVTRTPPASLPPSAPRAKPVPTLIQELLPNATTNQCRRNRTEHPELYVKLWGKFGLLNNRVRCLANTMIFTRRLGATLVLTETWEQFTSAVFDLEWMAQMEPSIVIAAAWPPEQSNIPEDNILSLSCSDTFWCGGACESDTKSIRKLEGVWNVPEWKKLRAGGQRLRTHSKELYDAEPEPTICGYAALLPKATVRASARQWAGAHSWFGPDAIRIVAHHQRLQTTVLHEPVSQMCFASAKLILLHYDQNEPGATYLNQVCHGTLEPNVLLEAAEIERKAVGHVKSPTQRVFLASDRFQKNITEKWMAHPSVDLYSEAEAVDPFQTTLGKALYASRFEGGPKGRRTALEKEVVPVFIDMVLLASADDFWPTPGSTMSLAVCFWRKVWTGLGVARLKTCEEIVDGWK